MAARIVVGACGVVLIAAMPAAHADPLNPHDPDYCGSSADILYCADSLSTYPNAQEMAYLNAIRGMFPPGSEARRLAAGRAACLEFPRYPAPLIVEQIAAYLQIPTRTAAQVVDVAHANICPAVPTQG